MQTIELGTGIAPENLVSEADSKMCRGEMKVHHIIDDDLLLQNMLATYSKCLRISGHDETFDIVAWIHFCDPGKWMDDVLMNAGIGSLQWDDSIAILRRNHVATLQTYVLKYSRGILNSCHAAVKLEEVVGRYFGAESCTTAFIPICGPGQWGFIVVCGEEGGNIRNGASVSWGDTNEI